MTAWHRSRRADLGLRAAGLLFCWLSYAALARLAAMHMAPPAAGIAAFGLAAIGFVGASGGSALLFLGNHLFDEIDVGARWRPRPEPLPFFPPEDTPMMNDVESAMLVVGRDVDGSWTVRESAGMLLGRFSSVQAAQRFALAERRGSTGVSVAMWAGTTRRIEGRLSLASSRAADLGVARG